MHQRNVGTVVKATGALLSSLEGTLFKAPRPTLALILIMIVQDSFVPALLQTLLYVQ